MSRSVESAPLPPILFVGGPGRSGTSFVADRLGRHPEVASLPDIELKIFCERNGLQDLFHVLVESYSPNRARTVTRQFRQLVEALVAGRHGQPALTTVAPAARWQAIFDAFLAALADSGHPRMCSEAAFLTAARRLLARIAAVAGAQAVAPAPAPATESTREDRAPRRMQWLFLEKTPHNLLALPFLARLAPAARYLHVMRDPRAIAWSLTTMRWGPGELAEAAAWVANYCRAWTRAETFAAEHGLPLLRVHIEDLAAAPGAGARRLTSTLGLEPVDDLLAGAEPGLLERWITRAGRAERRLLDRRLGGWARHFGYDPETPDRRASSVADSLRAPDPSAPLVPAPLPGSAQVEGARGG